jgi:hypothetical protein
MPKDTHTERWLAAAGYEGYYEVSDRGRVRSVSRTLYLCDGRTRPHHGKLRAISINSQGQHYVTLHTCGSSRTELVHHLVLETFVGPRPSGLEGCHWDDDSSNNAVDNLRWDTHGANMRDCVRNGNNQQSLKITCPRRHVLVSPNLVVSKLAIGRRECLACRRAAVGKWHAHRLGRPFDFRTVADQHYRRIMAA